MKRVFVFLLVVLLLFCAGCGGIETMDMGGLGTDSGAGTQTDGDDTAATDAPAATSTPAPTNTPEPEGLTLTTYDGGFFSLIMPVGWQLETFGQYASFGFRMTNSDEPGQQVFVYGKLEPYLKSYDAKDVWQSLYGTGIFPDAPVLTDRSAGGLLSIWDDCISYMQLYGDTTFTPLYDFRISSNESYSGIYTAAGASESMAIASCTDAYGTDCTLALSTAVFDPGEYYALGVDTYFLTLYQTVGILGPTDGFADNFDALLQCAGSLTFSEEYIAQSKQASDAQLADVTAQIAANDAMMDAINAKWREYILQ